MKTRKYTVTWIALLAGLALAPTWARDPKILHEATLPPVSMEVFGYTPADLAAFLVNATGQFTSADRPAIGSGLQNLGGNRYLGVMDRGPTFTSGTKRILPFAAYSPDIVFFRAIGDQLWLEGYTHIVDQNGTPVTGQPPTGTGEVAYNNLADALPLPANDNGLDPEGIHALPQGGYLLVEEYGPSIAAIQANGVVARRYMPQTKLLPAANYPVSNNLPDVLKNRRLNRGFEGLTVSPDGRTAYAVMQSPLGSTAAGSPYRNSAIVRILQLDVTDPANAVVTGQYLYRESPISVYPGGNQRDLKVSAAAWVDQGKLLLIERSDEVGIGGVRLVLVDLNQGSNVHGLPVANTLDLEDVTKGPTFFSLSTVGAQVVFEEFQNSPNRFFGSYKLEGLAILNRNDVALINDNDFGIDAVPFSQLKVLRLANQLPLGR